MRRNQNFENQIYELTSTFYASVLLLVMDFVVTLSKLLWVHEAIGGREVPNDLQLGLYAIKVLLNPTPKNYQTFISHQTNFIFKGEQDFNA